MVVPGNISLATCPLLQGKKMKIIALEPSKEERQNSPLCHPVYYYGNHFVRILIPGYPIQNAPAGLRKFRIPVTTLEMLLLISNTLLKQHISPQEFW